MLEGTLLLQETRDEGIYGTVFLNSGETYEL